MEDVVSTSSSLMASRARCHCFDNATRIPGHLVMRSPSRQTYDRGVRCILCIAQGQAQSTSYLVSYILYLGPGETERHVHA
jgi:hypothetical protein